MNENKYVTKFADRSFFQCADKMITQKSNKLEYKGVKIEIDTEKKELLIKIV